MWATESRATLASLSGIEREPTHPSSKTQIKYYLLQEVFAELPQGELLPLSWVITAPADLSFIDMPEPARINFEKPI